MPSMNHAEAYLPETRTSGRADVMLVPPGGDGRRYEDHFVRVNVTNGVVGIFEPEERRPIVTTSLVNVIIEWKA